MAQKRTHLDKVETEAPHTISICDIMHSNANTIIEKLESLLPSNMEMYSDFYAEYLHSLQDLFGACYIAENEILSRMGIDQRVLQASAEFTKALTKSAISQIEMANNTQKAFLQNQITAIKTSDQYIHLMLDYYSKILSGALGIIKKP
ncbi:MAG TPA: hypothetical protein VJ792_08950 [Candidatus Nitrosotalea sp.]|nr:hypothetical protein [Candidatus Nitrosotalea sp.]